MLFCTDVVAFCGGIASGCAEMGLGLCKNQFPQNTVLSSIEARSATTLDLHFQAFGVV